MNNPLTCIDIFMPAVNIAAGNMGEQTITKTRYLNPAFSTGKFPVTDSCERSAQVMGEDYVRLVFKLEQRIQFDAFSFIEYGGFTFFLKESYRPQPIGSFTQNGATEADYYEYDMKFYSVADMLEKHVCYRHVVVGDEQWNEPEININGTLDTLYLILMGAIQQAANRLPANLYYRYLLQSVYDNGTVASGTEVNSGVRLTLNTPLTTFSLNAVSIKDALTTVANGYEDTEWFITEQQYEGVVPSLTLHICKQEDTDNSVLILSDYTYPNSLADKKIRPYITCGLLSCEYAQEWTGVAEEIIPFGSDRNMTKKLVADTVTNMMVAYGKRVRLKSNTTYTFTDDDGVQQSVTTDENGGIRNPNVDTGIEQVKFYEEVYPQCHFRVTSVVENMRRIDGELQPRYTIEGEAIDKDGNVIPKVVLAEQGMFPISIIEAETLSVTFESGLLAGREFEITNKTTKDKNVREYTLRFIIVADGDIQDGTLIPSGNFVPKVGDTFALFNMEMPEGYLLQAQNDLAKEAWKELKALEQTRPEVKCTSDPTNFGAYDIFLGRRVELHSEIFRNDNAFLSRVISYSYNLTTPDDVSFSLASAVMQGMLSALQSAIGENVKSIGGLDQRAVNLSRRGWHDASEMAELLDALVAQMMLVGVEKNQFVFTFAIECVNAVSGGIERFSHLKIGNGSLQHTQEPWINQHNGTWYIEASDHISVDVDGNMLDSELPYYLYATLQDDTDIAQCRLFSVEQSVRDSCETDEHYLLLGVLSSEFEDGNTSYRVFNRSNGYTQIAGGTITTEQIQDAGRNLIIDFQSNPPRIIARKNAHIIGNITFTSPQGNEVDLSKYIGELEAKATGTPGGENLYDRGDPTGTIPYFGTDVFLLSSVEAGKTYVATYQQASEWAVYSCLILKSGATPPTASFSYMDVYYTYGLNNIDGVYKWGEPIPVNGNDRRVYALVGITYENAKRLFKAGGRVDNECLVFDFTPVEGLEYYFKGIMLQEGERATGYQAATKHLTDAIENGSTEVVGGLVVTNVIMLKDEKGNVVAGMSGVVGTTTDPENVLMWGGGNYAQALEALKGLLKLPVLLTKTGYGSNIGCFKVMEDNESILVEAEDNKIIITNKTISDSGAKIQKTQQGEIGGGKGAYGDPTDDKGGQSEQFSVQHFIIGENESGHYNIVIPKLEIKAEYMVRSYDTSGKDDGFADASISYNLCLRIVNNGTVLYSSPYKSLDNFGSSNDSAGQTLTDTNTAYISKVNQTFMLEAGTLDIEIYGSWSVVASDEEENYQHAGSDAEAKISISTENYKEAVIRGVDKYSVIAKDGIAVIANSDSAFYVQNDSLNTLKIIAKGLPNNIKDLNKGQIWRNSDNQLCIIP